MKLADVNNALGTARGQYEFFLDGGHSFVGRISGISPNNDLLVINYTSHTPPITETLRILIRLDAIVAIVEQ